MPHQHYLAKSQPYRLFNHVADKIAHGDDRLCVDAHLLANKPFAVVAGTSITRVNPDARLISSSSDSERFQLSSDIGVTMPVVPIMEMPPRMPSRELYVLRPRFAFRGKNLHIGPTRRAYRFAHR